MGAVGDEKSLLLEEADFLNMVYESVHFAHRP